MKFIVRTYRKDKTYFDKKFDNFTEAQRHLYGALDNKNRGEIHFIEVFK